MKCRKSGYSCVSVAGPALISSTDQYQYEIQQFSVAAAPPFLFVGFLKAAVWDSALYLGKVRQNPCEFIRAMQLNIMA